MNNYILRLIIDNSRVDSIQSNNLKEAVEFYRLRKKLDKKSFDKLYKVEKNGR